MSIRIGKAACTTLLLCCLAGSAPESDALGARALALDGAEERGTVPSTECTLGDECERWGTSLEGGGVEATCPTSAGPPTPPVWYQSLADPSCPFGNCTLYDQQLTLDADGSLITLGTVQLPSQIGSGREGGLWFTRHARGGAPLGTALWDFSAPPPGVDIERHGALLRDRTGRALFVSARAVQPFDAPRALQASAFSRAARPSNNSVFSTPRGWGITSALGPTGEWVVASQRTAAAGGPQASVTLYGRNGRTQWMRTWPERNTIEAVQVTDDRAVLVLALELSGGDRHSVLYKLDAHGTVAWRRVVSTTYGAPQVVAAANAIYVAAQVSSMFSSEVHVQKIEWDGARSITWVLPEGGAYTLARGEAGDAFLLQPDSSNPYLPTLEWYAFGAESCQRTLYALPGADQILSYRMGAYADRRGARFFAAVNSIGQLREGGRP